MGEIKQLPQNVANQISAGEVVERPASIVKELIENSIDARAENIEIRIKEGGRKLIQVKDDGHGILPDDIKAAFNRYATSKIEDIDDLYSLYSLGFRGEALASIASVAEVEMLSRHKEKENGVKIRLKGGEVIKKKPAASTIGTEVKVRDLFYNTPARYKYLKTT
ncbi:MAG: DNA mismatch repair protein MutL, partial [Halanaerobium sp. MSAO_Bac5]